MILAYIPTADIGTIAIMGILPEDLALLAEGEETPLVEFEEAMQRGIPLPKFFKMVPVRDQAHFVEWLNAAFKRADVDFDASKFKPLAQIEKLYERDDDD